jgi:hypothetical protein
MKRGWDNRIAEEELYVGSDMTSLGRHRELNGLKESFGQCSSTLG